MPRFILCRVPCPLRTQFWVAAGAVGKLVVVAAEKALGCVLGAVLVMLIGCCFLVEVAWHGWDEAMDHIKYWVW